MSLKGLRFTLEVDGQEPDTFAVVSFRLIQNQSYPFVMSVDVASDSFMQTAEMLLEKNATLTIWQGVIPLRYVTGVVAGFGMQENNGWQMRYHLRIQPPLWRCGLRQNFRIFQQQDIRTISATLLNENGVTEWTPLFYEDHPAREFCVQYGESDLAIPRVGQEVIVDFLNGDPDQPVVMGRTYHEDNRSPGDLPGTKTQMTIRSKTYKGSGFNELRFEDATSNEQVYIHAQKNMDTEVLNDRTTDVKHDHTETIGNDQKITVVKGQTVQVGTRKEGGHDQSITVANDRRITVRNDQTLKVTNDRTVSVSHDDGLYVRNDRRVTVKGKQEHKTTGNHVSLVEGKHSLVEGKHSLVVKGDLARKVSGALGIKVDGDIVLESSSRISLKVGGSFVVIHSGGVDIVGPKISLNSGGSPGTPVPALQPAVLKTLGDEKSGDGSDSGEENEDSGGNCVTGSGGDDRGDDEDEPEKYTLQFHFTDDDGIPYSETRYIAFFEDGTQTRGETDEEGYTERFFVSSKHEIKVKLLFANDDFLSMEGHYGR
ncbi:type VI secretion system tip protein VgrG [Escherichia coli]|nr:type VI secretion system tip protein VgrG [Escherichia coli]